MNRKISLTAIIVISVLSMSTVNAQRGCCSHHGGVSGCSSNGRQICKDGTLSPSCTCTPVLKDVYGCTDSKAKNYDKNATKDDDSCEYHVYGCMDEEAKNYNENVTKDDGTYEYYTVLVEKETALDDNNNNEDDNSNWVYGIITVVLGIYTYKKIKR